MSPRFCEVALPVPLRSTFTYAIPEHFACGALLGRRVVVPFRNRSMIGVVVKESAKPSDTKRTKEIAEFVDDVPALRPALIELGLWVSRYYAAPVGETFRAMLPPMPEKRERREFELPASGTERLENLKATGPSAPGESAEVAILTAAARKGGVSLSKLRRISGGEGIARSLSLRGFLRERTAILSTRERTQKIAAWNIEARAETSEEERVREILSNFRGPLPIARLLEQGVSQSRLARLESEKKIAVWDEPVMAEEDSWDADFIAPSNVLNAEQQHAANSIREGLRLRAFSSLLLHGVTGSGKTEVYLAAVASALAEGRGTIVLVPEIALTLWLSRLVRARFGAIVAVLHSALGDRERAREWWRVRRGEARVVLGTRSAVFAPVENLGLIIVDEEQESSYKQEEAPRYHGRDVAIMRARMEGAVALLGSATPSLETFENARSGKYKLLELRARVANRPLASVKIVDLREEFRSTHRSQPVSQALVEGIRNRLGRKEQALVLINRRGYSWYVLCRSCGAAVECRNCSITLSYHKRRGRLECHYCGYSVAVPNVCPKCKSQYLYFVGDGAERIEEFLREEFPEARIARLDRDTARTKRAYQKILGAFARGEMDILVGTQMVAKGHDFERVTLVGVAAADLALGRPDFRAAERTFQLLTQVAGRAGRGGLPGEVLIETHYPEHYAIEHAVTQDYTAFFEREIHFRRMMQYPPFIALANVMVRSRKMENAIRWSHAIAGHLDSKRLKDLRVLGPAAAALSRLRGEYRFQILLKMPSRPRLGQVLAECFAFCERKKIPENAIIVDVDPVNLL